MIYISRCVIDGVEREAKNTYPEECCGLLEGFRIQSYVKIDNFHPSLNTANNLGKEFEIDVRLRLSLQRELRQKNKKIVGVYHSHPNENAHPSKYDVQRAWEADLIWLIASIKNDLDCNTAVFTISDSKALSWKKKYINNDLYEYKNV